MWLAGRADRARFVALEQELAAPARPVRSMATALRDKLVAPAAIALLMRLLAWDPARRVSASDAALDQYLSGAAHPLAPAGRDVVDQKSLSDQALERWIAEIRK